MILKRSNGMENFVVNEVSKVIDDFTKTMKPNKPQTLFLAWQDYESRVWFPIGRLTFDGARYQFIYIKGAKDAEQQCEFQPLISFFQWDKVYY